MQCFIKNFKDVANQEGQNFGVKFRL